MPIIPYQPFASEGPRPAPPEDYQRIPTTPREFGAQIGAGEERLGAGLEQAGDIYGQIAADDQANHVLEGLDDLNMKLRALQGRDRMDQYPVIRKQMDDLVNQARGNLSSPNQVIDFNRQVRYLHSRALRESGDLYDQAQQQWGLAVNKGGANLSLLGISKAAAAGDFDAVKNHEQDLINWRMKDAALVYGHDLAPEIRTNVADSAKRESIEAQVRALQPVNPQLARKILEDNRSVFAGTTQYDALDNSTKAHAFRSEVDGLVAGALGGGTSGGAPARGTTQEAGLPPGPEMPNAFLASQRSRFKQELEQNPALERKLAAVIDLENPSAGTAVVESLFNRMAMSGGTLESGLASGPNSFYGPLRRGEEAAKIRELQNNPSLYAARLEQIDRALAGSNIVRGHTDQGSQGDPNYEAGGVGVNIGGERFNDWAGAGGVGTARAWRVAQQAQVGDQQGQSLFTTPMQARQAATDLGAQGGLVSSGAVTPAYRSPGLTAALDHIAQSDASPEAKELAAARVERRFNAQIADENRYEAALRKQRNEASDQRENQIIADAASPTPKITATDIGAERLPDGSTNPLTPEARIRMIRYINQESRPEALTHLSHETSMALFSDIRRPTGDPQKMTDTGPILDAYGQGLLTRADRDDLITQLTNAKDPSGEKLAVKQKEFITRFTPMISNSNPIMGKLDPEGQTQLYNYDFAISQKIADYRKQGKDPNDLFDPRNPEFVGAPAFVRQFQSTFQQSLKAKTGAISAPPMPAPYPGTPTAPTVQPRQPNESIPDYLKRIGGAVSPIPPAAAAPASAPTPTVPAAPMPAPPIARP